MSVQKIVEKLQGKTFSIAGAGDGDAFAVTPSKPFATDKLLAFEKKNGVELPSAYKDFVTRYGAARFFGAQFLPLQKVDFVYRYDEKQIGPKGVPATVILLFASVDFLSADADFGFVLSCERDLRQPDTKHSWLVRAWAGDVHSGAALDDDIAPQPFEKWLGFWAGLIESKAD